MSYSRLALVGVVVVSALSALSPQAQEPKSQQPGASELAAMMEKAKRFTEPGKHHKLLEKFLGKWDTETRIFMGTQSTPAEKGTAETTWQMEGRWLKTESKGTMMGTRFKETRIVFKREATETMEVVAFDPPRGYTLGAESCGCRYRIRFRFAPASDGTDVELKFDAEPLTFLARLMGFLMGRMIEMCAKESAKDLEDLKAAIEQGPQAAVATTG